MIYAEKRQEDGGTHGYFTLRYFVWNDDNLLGTYGVHYKPVDHAHSVPYSASRDYHKLATEAEIEARKVWDAFQALPDDEQNAAYDAGTEPDYPQMVDGCCYFDGKPTCCDGSGLVEIIDGDDKRAFEIAAMMADVESRECPVHEHDCDTCTFIGSYRLKHPYTDDDGYRTGTPGKRVDTADVYLACDNSGYKYIIRYGRWGEYATTNTVSHYALAPMIDGEDPNYSRYLIYDNANDPLEELSEDIFADLG